MQFRKIAVFLCGICSLTVLSAGIELLPNGTVKIDDTATLGIAHYNDKWVPRGQADSAVKTTRTSNADNAFDYRSIWDMPGGKTAQSEIRARIEKGGQGCSLDYLFSATEPLPTASLSIQMELPVWNTFGKPVIVDGRELFFPENPAASSTVASFDAVRKVELPLKTGILTVEAPEPVKLLVADFRPFHRMDFALRFAFRPDRGALTRSELGLKLSFEPYVTFPLALDSAANMGFSDDTANDQKGGWTDQGPTNDLRMIKSGDIAIPPMTFQILDPARNEGKSCIVLGGGGKPYFPRKAEIPVGGRSLQTVSLLHALAWPPEGGTEIGTVTANYRDGHKVSVPVVAWRDVANWWAPARLKNGRPGWQGHNQESTVGLYLSNFRFPAGEMNSITLESNGKSVWMIAAAGASSQTVWFAEPVAYTVGRNTEWRAFPDTRSIEPGSALDFSFLQDAPAGKYGFVQVRNGHFQFEKALHPIRFYGANICFGANYLPPERCDQLAERLAKIGYNAVRLHHFDRNVVKDLPKDSKTVNPDSLKQLDYLIFALKKQGIYITTDLFTVRTMHPGEFSSIPNLSNPRDYKLAAMILPEVNENLKTLTRELFTHVNPYTGMRWADDPVFVGISLLNENTILHNINMVSPEIRKIYRDRFEKYAKENNLAASGGEGEENFSRFVLKVYHDYYGDMVKFMQGIGVRAPLTDQNYISTPNAAEQRVRYDYVDNHTYWDHPSFMGHAWSLPAQFKNTSALKSRLQVPAEIAPSRIFGKPFTVTEFDFCYPNRYRAEGSPLFAAYAALQDWDGLYHFAYSHSADNLFTSRGIELFDVVNDPVRLLSERIGIAFFLRRDVKSAEEAFPVAVSAAAYKNYLPAFPAAVRELMFFGRVGSVLRESAGKFLPALPKETRAIYALDPEMKAGECAFPLLRAADPVQLIREMRELKLIPPSGATVNAEQVTSLTGELSADFSKGTFQAETSRSVVFVLPESERSKGGFLSAETRKNFAVVSAIALDGKELKESNRILLFHLTDVKVEGDKFASEEMNVLRGRDKSGVPLAQHGIVELTVKSDRPGWNLYAIDLSGRRIAEVPFQQKNGELTFRADNFAIKGQVVFAYELTRSE